MNRSDWTHDQAMTMRHLLNAIEALGNGEAESAGGIVAKWFQSARDQMLGFATNLARHFNGEDVVTPKVNVEIFRVNMADGVWEVRQAGDKICIVDSKGRARHFSQGHDGTAVHLAMALAERRLDENENADAALRMSAEKFLAENH